MNLPKGFTRRKIKPFLSGKLSNWYPSEFTINNVTFNCAEQYMMYMKAGIFGDNEIGDKILKSNSPSEQKKLGRKIKNFDQVEWNIWCRHIMTEGLKAKFTQHKECKNELLSTKGYLLVEGNKNDVFWGVGLDVNDPAIYDIGNWKGFNYLGFILTDIRFLIKE